jgi:hypothetical protein
MITWDEGAQQARFKSFGITNLIIMEQFLSVLCTRLLKRLYPRIVKSFPKEALPLISNLFPLAYNDPKEGHQRIYMRLEDLT